MDGAYDEVLERFHRTGPEYDEYLSNHGPMATDALIRMGFSDKVHSWADDYLRRMEPRPSGSPALGPWEAALGDPSRLGDWLAYFSRLTAEQPWQEVLTTWWPRLLPGLLAAATHGVIRTGHAVRRLREEDNPVRRAELGDALASWAARFVPLPLAVPSGRLLPAQAYDDLPVSEVTGGARDRAAALGASWASAAASVRRPDDVSAALADLVDAAVTRYAHWAPANPTMLVHMATAPRAVSLVVPSLPASMHRQAYDFAWDVSAAIGAMYRPGGDPHVTAAVGDVASDAYATADVHAIKFTEVALESQARGNRDALAAAALSSALANG
jgi:hypothetical protein